MTGEDPTEERMRGAAPGRAFWGEGTEGAKAQRIRNTAGSVWQDFNERVEGGVK